MVASLAHQVRTPLATAILYASQMAQPKLIDSKRQQFSEKILERLQYLERQVNDMLIFAKQGRLAMQGFSLQQMFARVDERMETFNGVFLLDNRVEEDCLQGNQDALQGALNNLLNNAIEAGADMISLVAVQMQHAIEITIQDNGPGMEAEQQAQLFEPFYTTKIHGTGLGLAVVESVVKAHKGSVRCHSALGQGCVFVLNLPILESQLGLSSLASMTVNHQENSYETV
jgi:two-component system sensor histidine kinase FlrB